MMYDLLLPLGMKGLKQAHLRVNLNSKQNLFEEKLNSQKLIWFYLLEKKFLSTIMFVRNFVAFNYQKVITDR